jgi:hypothetical protein
VDLVIEKTKLEVEHRRKETSAINKKIYFERVLSIVVSMIICSLGIIGGGYIVLHGQAWAGTTTASVSIGTLAVSYLRKSTKNVSQLFIIASMVCVIFCYLVGETEGASSEIC